ncbi:hypothetical protein TcCL_ESM11640 [Trypanosoma cruzi]|nr:hypothetical protein TcCL_ESM11640 [Trypanosoma cruzi]
MHHIVKEKRICQSDNEAPAGNRVTGIITGSTKTAAVNCGVTCINCRMAYLEEKTRWLYKNTSSCHFLSRINDVKTKRNIQSYAVKACRKSKKQNRCSQPQHK